MEKIDIDQALDDLTGCLKGLIVRPATRCELVFDIAEIRRVFLEYGAPVETTDIVSLIQDYCDILRKRNSRVLAMKVDNSTAGTLKVTLDVQLFDNDELGPIDEAFIRKAVVSVGQWMKGSGKPVRES